MEEVEKVNSAIVIAIVIALVFILIGLLIGEELEETVAVLIIFGMLWVVIKSLLTEITKIVDK